MRNLLWFAMLCLPVTVIPARALELQPLAECSVKVFSDIGRNSSWSGTPPTGCPPGIYVEQRPAGIFVTTWNSGSSGQGWTRLSFSAAMGFSEMANKKSLSKAGRDVKARAVRIERCLNSILRGNDTLECRDYGTKSYLAGEEAGFESVRQIWLGDDGRHSIAEYAFGDSRSVSTPPADLFSGPALPLGMKLHIHVFDSPEGGRTVPAGQ